MPVGDALIDACDNFETRFALNALAHTLGRPLVHGAASGWVGQSAVFVSGYLPEAPCYQCWVPEMPPDAAGCDEVGVVGPLTGMVATQLATSALSWLIDQTQIIHSQLYLFDGLSGRHRQLKIRKDLVCPICNSRNAK